MMKNFMNKSNGKRNKSIRAMVQIAMLSAVAGVLMLFEFPLPFLAPSFYELDFSEVPVLIGTFAIGPAAGATIELMKILLNFVMNGTITAGVGESANFLMGCAFVVPAGLIYRRKKDKKHALAGMVIGMAVMRNRDCLFIRKNKSHYETHFTIVLILETA